MTFVEFQDLVMKNFEVLNRKVDLLHVEIKSMKTRKNEKEEDHFSDDEKNDGDENGEEVNEKGDGEELGEKENEREGQNEMGVEHGRMGDQLEYDALNTQVLQELEQIKQQVNSAKGKEKLNEGFSTLSEYDGSTIYIDALKGKGPFKDGPKKSDLRGRRRERRIVLPSKYDRSPYTSKFGSTEEKKKSENFENIQDFNSPTFKIMSQL